ARLPPITPKTTSDQAHSRLISAITAPQTPRWRPPAPGDYAAQALTGTRRAALLGTCARAAPLGAIRPRRRGVSGTLHPSECRRYRRGLSPGADQSHATATAHFLWPQRNSTFHPLRRHALVGRGCCRRVNKGVPARGWRVAAQRLFFNTAITVVGLMRNTRA